MAIKSIHIQNFRGLKNTIIQFETGYNCLVGENGTGKTSVLEALNLVLSPSYVASRIDEQDFNMEDAGDISIIAELNVPLNVKVPDGYTTQEIPCDKVCLDIKRRDKATPGKAFSDEFVVNHYVMPIDEVERTDKGWKKFRASGSPFEFTIRHLSFPIDADLLRAFYFDRSRESELKVGYNSTLQRIAKEFNWRFRKMDDDKRPEFLEKWNEIYAFILSNIGDKKLSETLKGTQKKIEDFFSQDLKSLELSILNLEQPFQKCFLSLRDGLNQIDVSRVGAGLTMIVCFCLLDTISSLAREELVILIDEPELHLHPQLQSLMFKYLTKSANQVIISTHSEYFVDIAEWRSIKRFNSKKSVSPTTHSLNKLLPFKGADKPIHEHLDDIKRYYKDKTLFLRENNIILFSEKCLLVEGPVDKHAFSRLAVFSNINLEGLTIICCNGKDKLVYYQLICHAFSIPFFSVFDLDGKDENHEGNKMLSSWSLDRHYYGFKNSLEHVFTTHNKEHKANETMKAIDSCSIVPSELIEAFNSIQQFLKNESI